MKLNTLTIALQVDDTGDFEGQRPAFFIDGYDLHSLVFAYEKKQFPDDPAAGGGYLPIRTINDENECYFTRTSKEDDFIHEGGALLLTCECDEWGCWNLFCTIEFDGETVVWKDFRKHHRDWKYDLEFRFDKQKYLAEFERIKELFKDESY